MSRKHKKVCTTVNYIEHFLILASTVTGCISISAFSSLIGIPIRDYIKYTLHYSNGTTRTNLWKPNEMSKENFENETKSDSNFAPSFADHHALPDINFNEQCLINNIHIPKKVINIYISYTLNP